MVSQADLDLIQNFAIELEPFVHTVMAGVQEFRRTSPDSIVVGQAVQALGMIRGAGSILMLDPLVRISDMLSEAFEILETNTPRASSQAAEHLFALSTAMTTSIQRLVSGEPAADVVDRAHRSLAGMMRALVEEDARNQGTDKLRALLLHGEPHAEHNGGFEHDANRDMPAAPTVSLEDPGERPEVDPELRDIFMEEATELVATFRDTAIALVRAPHDRGLVDELRRTAHTLKGAANMTGYDLVGSVGAAVENLLDGCVERDLDPDRDALEMIVVCWKMLPAMLKSIDDLSSFVSPVASIERRSRYLLDRLTQADQHIPDDDVQVTAPDIVHGEPQAEAGAAVPDEKVQSSTWPAAAKLREVVPHAGEISQEQIESDDVESDHVSETRSAQDGLSGDRLGSALLDLAFAADAQPSQAPEQRDTVQQDVYDEQREAEFAREMRLLFAEECADTLTLLSRAAIELDRDATAAAPLQTAMRALHTLKGGAYAAGEVAIADACHELESVLSGDDASAIAGAMFAAIDTIERLLGGSSDTPDAEPVLLDKTEARLRVPVSSLDEMLNLVGELVVNRAGLEQRLERMTATLAELQLTANRLHRSGTVLEQQSHTGMNGNLTGPSASDGWDDLEFDRYTELDRLSRELAEIGADITATVNELSGLRGDMDSVSSRQRRLANSLQDRLMDVRMVPLGDIAPRFYRVIRQVAENRDKQVRLVVEGGDTAFDSTLLDALGESMVHLLRNAVDHGIETPEIRRRAGKPEQGTVRIRAYRDGGESVIEVHDDGAGIDVDRVRARAVERGLHVPGSASRSDLLQLVFEPGFSTRDQADEVSGRGVGLDVVQSTVESFKGRVLVESSPGGGTTIRLRLPVMLSVAQAFMVRAAGEAWAVPIDNIDLVVDRRESPLTRIGDALVLESGDTAIPVVDLGQHLGRSSDTVSVDDGWVMVASVAGERRALCVDELEGQQDVVVKPLGRLLRHSQGVLGATILGNGDVALIVDVVRLLQPDADLQIASGPGEGSTSQSPHDDHGARRPVAIIVDDSLSVRRVVGRTLERHGWTAVLTRDGQEALDAIEQHQVDAIITDIEMPRMDGYDLIASLKSHAATRSIPVVVLTSRSSQKHRERAIELGAADYVVKPFQEQQLLQALELASGIAAGAVAV